MVYVDKVDTLFIKNASQGLCVRWSRELAENNNNFVLTDAWQVQDKGPDLSIQTLQIRLHKRLQLQLQLVPPTTPHKGQQRKQTVR